MPSLWVPSYCLHYRLWQKLWRLTDIFEIATYMTLPSEWFSKFFRRVVSPSSHQMDTLHSAVVGVLGG